MFNNNNSRDIGTNWNKNNSNVWNNKNDNTNINPMFGNPSTQVHGIRDYYDRSLIPTTIKKILTADDPEPDGPFRIDGKQVHQIQIIASIKSITHQTTHTSFIVDDYGAKIKCKLWSSDNDDIKQLDDEKLKINDLVKIIGKVDIYKSTRSINVHNISKIKNHDMVHQHGIEVIFAFELNNILINQHIPKYKNMWNTYIKNAHNEQQQTRLEYQKSRKQNINTNNNNSNNDDNKQDETKLNQFELKVLNFLRTSRNNNSDTNDYLGQSINDIGNGIGWSSHNNKIRNALAKLYKNGMVHDTIDKNHWNDVVE